MRKVLVFGAFDGLHPGHVSFLRQARRHGDLLIAVVTRDENVRRSKGRRPAHGERKRMADLRPYADKVMLGERKVTYGLIRRVDPDVICIGYDQEPGIAESKRILRDIGMPHVELRRMRPYKPRTYKSEILNEARDSRA